MKDISKDELAKTMEDAYNDFIPPKTEQEAKIMMTKHLMIACMAVMAIKDHPMAPASVMDSGMVQLMGLSVWARKFKNKKDTADAYEGTDTVLR